jgi:hypothetical protein
MGSVEFESGAIRAKVFLSFSEENCTVLFHTPNETIGFE